MGSTHYFDTSTLNYLADAPDGNKFAEYIKNKDSDRIFISPINIEEIKLAPFEKRSKIIAYLNSFKEKILLVMHPDAIGLLEFKYALDKKRFNGSDISEHDDSELKNFEEFLAHPEIEINDKERHVIERKKLMNKYVQTCTRKEPKGKYDFADVIKYRSEIELLSNNELRRKISVLNNLNFINEHYKEKDIINGIRVRLVQIVSHFRPGVKYFFDSKNGPKLLEFLWPGKQGDQRIAKRIMEIDFRADCPGTWIKDNVYFLQSNKSIELGNWADGVHSFYLAYVGYFWTSDRNLFDFMKLVRVSNSNHCGMIMFLRN